MNLLCTNIRQHIFSFVYPRKISKGSLLFVSDFNQFSISKCIFIKYCKNKKCISVIPLSYMDNNDNRDFMVCFYVPLEYIHDKVKVIQEDYTTITQKEFDFYDDFFETS